MYNVGYISVFLMIRLGFLCYSIFRLTSRYRKVLYSSYVGAIILSAVRLSMCVCYCLSVCMGVWLSVAIRRSLFTVAIYWRLLSAALIECCD